MKLFTITFALVVTALPSCKQESVSGADTQAVKQVEIAKPWVRTNENKFIDLLEVAGLRSSIKDWGPFWQKKNQDNEGIIVWAVLKPKERCYRIYLPNDKALPCEVSMYWPLVKSSKLILSSEVEAEREVLEDILRHPLEFRKLTDGDFMGSALRASFIVQKIEKENYSWAVRPTCDLILGDTRPSSIDAVRLFKLLNKFIKLSDLAPLEPSRF